MGRACLCCLDLAGRAPIQPFAGVQRDARVGLIRATAWSHSRDQACVCRMPRRSEEHTSELQSLMRISYAVFCLKKKRRRTKWYAPTNRQITDKETKEEQQSLQRIQN